MITIPVLMTWKGKPSKTVYRPKFDLGGGFEYLTSFNFLKLISLELISWYLHISMVQVLMSSRQTAKLFFLGVGGWIINRILNLVILYCLSRFRCTVRIPVSLSHSGVATLPMESSGFLLTRKVRKNPEPNESLALVLGRGDIGTCWLVLGTWACSNFRL